MFIYGWCICLAAAILFMLRALYILFDKSNGKLRMGKSFVYMLVASYVIYLPILDVSYSLIGILVGDLMNVMQIISLDASYLDNYELIQENIYPDFIFQMYLLFLGVIHFLVPLMAATTAYTFFAHCMSVLKLKMINVRGKKIYIFSRLDENAMKIVVDILKHEKKKATFIFADSRAVKGEHDEVLDKTNYTILNERVSRVSIHVRNADKVTYFLASGSDDENINDALELIEKHNKESKTIQKKIYITLFSENPEAETMIDSANKGILNVRIVNKAQTSCYKLLNEYPLYQSIRKNMIHVLLVGFDSLGKEALKTVLWMGQLEGVRLKVSIIDENIQEKRAAFEFQCPEMTPKEYEICYLEAGISDASFPEALCKCGDVSYIIVSGREDESNISTSIYLRRYYLKTDPEFQNWPFIAVHLNSESKYQTVKELKTPETKPERKAGYGLTPFGEQQSVYTYEELVNSPLEQLSKNVHMAYEEIFSGGELEDVESALERFQTFEVNKHSNLANALHIRYKLHLMGLDFIDRADMEEVDFSEYLSEQNIGKLARAEHDRWMAFLRSEGWTTAAMEQVNAYKKSDLSKGRHNCPLLKMHPYICPNEDLPSISEQLELMDATIYDIELIRRIPDILEDKWGIANKKYKIIKAMEEEDANKIRSKNQ